jgi:chemotaxis protein methyltransferase CheR
MNSNITDTELSKVCEVIAENLGLHFPEKRWSIFVRSLANAGCESGFQDTDSYIHWILSNKLNSDQLSILASHLTTGETYFWREPEVFTALTDSILPAIISLKKKGEKSINIWSSGCSTGEEPYSIAIALHHTIPDIKDWKIYILATDINQKALDKAVAGIYGPWSFRNTPEWVKKKYFNKLEDQKYGIIPEIKKMVTFGIQNLAKDKYSFPGQNAKPKDIIFCRNVLMYFTEKWVNKISQNFYNSLSDEGWLVVSSTELSSHIFHQFSSVTFLDALLYRKTKKGSIPSSVDHPFSYIESSNIEIQPINLSPYHPITLSPYHPINLSTHQPFNPSTPDQPYSNEETPEDYHNNKISAIRLLANQGHLQVALTLCNETIASEKLIPCFYFLRASILQEMNNISEAIISLKQVVYLDPDYVMGHFVLGNLLNQEGNEKSAKRYFGNVLDLLKRYSNNDILPDSDGLSVKHIREIIYANMETIRIK